MLLAAPSCCEDGVDFCCQCYGGLLAPTSKGSDAAMLLPLLASSCLTLGLKTEQQHLPKHRAFIEKPENG
jgi:hypothetical protein